MGRVSDSVCVSVFPVIPVRYQISVISGPIELKYIGEVENTHSLILQKIHNDSFHDKNASEKY